MPPKRKNEKAENEIQPKKNPVWSGFKDFGRGILEFFTILFDFLLKLIKIILYFSVWMLGGAIVLVLITALAVYLISAGLGVKNNEAWQQLINRQIQKVIILDSRSEVFDEIKDNGVSIGETNPSLMEGR